MSLVQPTHFAISNSDAIVSAAAQTPFGIFDFVKCKKGKRRQEQMILFQHNIVMNQSFELFVPEIQREFSHEDFTPYSRWLEPPLQPPS